MTTVRAGSATDVGRVRQINEDRFLVADDLFAVADGVGGHQAGEVAAQTSVEALKKCFTERTTDGLVEAIQRANQEVWQLAQGAREKRGMGTTITAVALVNDDGEEQLALANVGDSRAYLLQQGELIQLTEDHSLVEELVREGQITHEEAQVHPQRSIITRALGMEPEIEVDSWQLIPYRGDRILLCTDGLTNEVSEDRIASTLRQLADPQEAARDLVRQARANGGSDNVTVVVIDVEDDGGRSERASEELGRDSTLRRTAPPPAGDGGGDGTGAGAKPSSGWSGARSATATESPPTARPAHTAVTDEDDFRPRLFTWRVALFASLLIGIILVAALAIGWYARSAYYVGIDGDRVAIFRGRPGGFLWFDPTLEERKSLTVHEVLPSRLPNLRSGHEEPSKADADRYVNNLRQEAAQARQQAEKAELSPQPPDAGAPPSDPNQPPGATSTVPTTVAGPP